MVRWYLFIAILHLSILTRAQNGAIMHFNKSVHSFNVIKEVDGKVNYDFVFVNKGNVPVIIKQVKSTCGCMSPQWTKAPVLPGKKGFVRATFDPDNRPGNFDKTITVYTNAKHPVQLLRIRGKVIPKKKTILDNYPYELPSGLRMTFDCITFRAIKQGKTKKIEIPVFNNHGKDLNVRFIDLPSYVKLDIVPNILKHRGKGKILAEIDTKDINELGLVKKEIVYLANGNKENMLVTANIKQDFTYLGQNDKANAPSIRLDKRLIKFGAIDTGNDIEFSINVSNSGKSILKMHRLYAYNADLEFTPALKDLKPGESQLFKIKVNTNNIVGKQKIIVGLISNDPMRPEIKIRLSGNLN